MVYIDVVGIFSMLVQQFPYYYCEISVIVFSAISMLLLFSTFCVARIDLREPVK